jgi:hypothetical protein
MAACNSRKQALAEYDSKFKNKQDDIPYVVRDFLLFMNKKGLSVN